MCFMTRVLQLYLLPAGRGFPRLVVWLCARGSSKSCRWKEALWDGVQTVAWPRLDAALPNPLRTNTIGARAAPALWQGFAALPEVFILALMCATRDGVSLSACCVFPAVCPCAQFPCSVALTASCLLCPVSRPPFLSAPSPIRAVSPQSCVKSHLFCQLLGWI